MGPTKASARYYTRGRPAQGVVSVFDPSLAQAPTFKYGVSQ